MQRFKLKLGSQEKFVEAKVSLILRPAKGLEDAPMLKDIPNEIKKFIDIDYIEINVTPELAQYGAMKDADLKENATAILTPNAKAKYEIQEKWYGLTHMLGWIHSASSELKESLEKSQLSAILQDDALANQLINKSFDVSDTKDAIFKFETIINVPVDPNKTVDSFIDAFNDQINWDSDEVQSVKVKFYYEPKQKIENPLDVVDIHKPEQPKNSVDSAEFKDKFKEVQNRYQEMTNHLRSIGKSDLIDPNWSNPKWLADKTLEELGGN